MSRYAGLSIPTLALPPGIPPPGCEVPSDDADMDSRDSDSDSDSESLSDHYNQELFVPGKVFFGLSSGFFHFFRGLSYFLLSFLLIGCGRGGFSMSCWCLVGSSWALGWVFFCFTGFPWFVSLYLRVFWFLCWAASALSLWVVLFFHRLSCLLFCFIASLLCFYLLIVFLILSAALYGFPISYLSIRF